MELIKLLKQLLKDKKINRQQFRTYKGQVLSGNEIPCVVGLMRKHLISDEEGNSMILQYKLGYTE